MSKSKQDRYPGTEDHLTKRSRDTWGMEELSQKSEEDKKPRKLNISRFLTKKALLGAGAFIAVLVLLFVFFRSDLVNEKDSAENQLYKMIKAHTDREYKAVGGRSLKGRDLWSRLGEIDPAGYNSLSKVGQQEFTDDVIAACNKAIAQESVKIGRKTYSTRHVSRNTVTAWIDGMQKTEAGERLAATFQAEIQPSFIPAYEGLTPSKLLILAVVFFFLICILFPKKRFSLPSHSNQQGDISRMP